jgi:transcriptional regulator with XRE-family HTH domain
MRHGEKKGKEISTMERARQAVYRAELGEYLKELRAYKGMSTRAVGEELNISSNYVSEIERGIKAPSDHTIREFAELYSVDEAILFDKLKRVPLKATELLESQNKLQMMLSEMKDTLEPEEQSQLFEIFEATYSKYLDNKKQGKQQNFLGRFWEKLKK